VQQREVSMQDDQIRAYFAFDEADLLANRNGQLSEKQSKRVREADRFAERFIFILFFVFLISGIFLAVLALSSRSSPGLWIGAIISLLLSAWLFRSLHTEVDDTIQKVQGKVNFVKVEKKTGTTTTPASQRMKVSGYEMGVGTEVFSNVNPALIDFMDGNHYTVYFTKRTRQILSVEKIVDGAVHSSPQSG
jgi:hypothetical protein